MSGSRSASSAQELAGYSGVRPSCSLQCTTSGSKAETFYLTSFTRSPTPEAEHSPSLPTSGGREAVQESAAKPPVAADNMKRTVARTAANIFQTERQ